MFSEDRLNLKALWFTGGEWADGTAEAVLLEQYALAEAREKSVESAKTPSQKAVDRKQRKQRRFTKWFEHSLRSQQ